MQQCATCQCHANDHSNCRQRVSHTSTVCAVEWSKLRALHTACVQGAPQHRELATPCFSFSWCAAALPQCLSIPTSFLLPSVPARSPAPLTQSQTETPPLAHTGSLFQDSFLLPSLSLSLFFSKALRSQPLPLISTKVFIIDSLRDKFSPSFSPPHRISPPMQFIIKSHFCKGRSSDRVTWNKWIFRSLHAPSFP